MSPKNPAIALLISFFLPGVGSMTNGDTGIGILILLCYIISWLFTWIFIGIPFLIGFWIWGLVNAYTGAQRWNARHGIVS